MEFLATQTLVPTMLAIGLRSGLVAYVVLRVAYTQVDECVWQSSRLDGGRLWRFWSVEIPLLGKNILAAVLAAMIVSGGDVPAALPVLPPGVTTVGTRLFGLLHSGARYQEASLAFWYVAVIIGIAVVALRLCQAGRKQNRGKNAT
jgi:iron(III) transport system permease protein